MNAGNPLVSRLKTKFLFRKPSFYINRASYTRLVEVGRLQKPLMVSNYNTGQLFFHKLFGYRGVILFPWTPCVYDRDLIKRKKKVRQKGEDKEDEDVKRMNQNEIMSKTQKTFYNVLIDARDCPFVRVKTEAVTFLSNQESDRNLFTIPGMDFVDHRDILPYTTTENHPLHHELLDRFLTHREDEDPPFVPKDTLLIWHRENGPWLELSDVFKETTENIRVTVIPFYMGCRGGNVHWWRYCVSLENLGDLSVRLREHYWRTIFLSVSGITKTVRSHGLVCQEIELSRALPAYQYNNLVSLRSPSGHMRGVFRMEREDGYIFDCKIPPFYLWSHT